MAGGLPHGWLHGIGVGIAGAIHSGQQHGRCVRAERMRRWDLRWYHDPGSEKEVDFAPEISKGFPSKMMNLYWFILLSDCIYLHSDFPVPGEWIDVGCLLLHLSLSVEQLVKHDPGVRPMVRWMESWGGGGVFVVRCPGAASHWWIHGVQMATESGWFSRCLSCSACPHWFSSNLWWCRYFLLNMWQLLWSAGHLERSCRRGARARAQRYSPRMCGWWRLAKTVVIDSFVGQIRRYASLVDICCTRGCPQLRFKAQYPKTSEKHGAHCMGKMGKRFHML